MNSHSLGCQNQASIINDCTIEGKTWGSEWERRFKELLGAKLVQFIRLHSTIIPSSFFFPFWWDFLFFLTSSLTMCLRIIDILTSKSTHTVPFNTRFVIISYLERNFLKTKSISFYGYNHSSIDAYTK